MLLMNYYLFSEALVMGIPIAWLPTMHPKYRIESSQNQAAARYPENLCIRHK